MKVFLIIITLVFLTYPINLSIDIYIWNKGKCREHNLPWLAKIFSKKETDVKYCTKGCVHKFLFLNPWQNIRKTA